MQMECTESLKEVSYTKYLLRMERSKEKQWRLDLQSVLHETNQLTISASGPGLSHYIYCVSHKCGPFFEKVATLAIIVGIFFILEIF